MSSVNAWRLALTQSKYVFMWPHDSQHVDVNALGVATFIPTIEIVGYKYLTLRMDKVNSRLHKNACLTLSIEKAFDSAWRSALFWRFVKFHCIINLFFFVLNYVVWSVTWFVTGVAFVKVVLSWIEKLRWVCLTFSVATLPVLFAGWHTHSGFHLSGRRRCSEIISLT